MKKRLFAAFLMVGAISAVMVMSASAFWTTGTATANVNAKSGTANLSVAGCDVSSTAGCSAPLQFNGIYPGWSSDPLPVNIVNTGSVPLNLVLELDGWSGNPLQNELKLDVSCGNSASGSGVLVAYDSGYSLGSLAVGTGTTCTFTLSLPESGSNQNNLQGQTLNFTANLYGKTN